MPLGKRHRCTSLEYLVAEYVFNSQVKILCLGAEIAYLPSHVQMLRNGRRPHREVFGYFWSSQYVWPYLLVNSTVYRVGVAEERFSCSLATPTLCCRAVLMYHAGSLKILHPHRPLLRIVWPSGQSAASIRYPHHCEGCCECIGAAGAVKQCRYNTKFHYYRRGTRFLTIMPRTNHTYVGQIEGDPDVVNSKYRISI